MTKDKIPELNARFLEVVKTLGYTGYSFSAKMDISQATFSNIRYGRRKPNIELVQKLVQQNPEIDADWLLLGQGTMFRKNKRSGSGSNSKDARFDRLETLIRKSIGLQMERSLLVDESMNDLEERMRAIEMNMKKARPKAKARAKKVVKK